MRNHINLILFTLLFSLSFNLLFAQKFDWAKAFESTGYSLSLSVETDYEGNVYTTGFFEWSTDFDPGPAVYELTSVAANDVFVSKLDSLGNFLWAKQFGGGISGESGLDIVTDHLGNVYFSGSFNDSVDFDPGIGVFMLHSVSTGNSFVCKLDPDGNFQWVKQFEGTSGPGEAVSLVLDQSSNCYIGGKFQNTTDFDPGLGIYPLVSSGGEDIFICKLDPNGNFIWAKKIGGSQSDILRSITLDNQGNIYSTGNFYGTVDFNPGSGIFNMTASQADVFISKLTNNGDFVWAKKMGGSLIEVGNGIKLDQSSNIYSIGHFKGAVDFDPGSGVSILSSNSNFEVYVQKLDSAGNYLWAKQFGSIDNDFGRGLDVDSSNNVYITGQFMGTVDFESGPSTYSFSTIATLNNRDVFICKLDSLGKLQWAKHIGGTGASDNSLGIDVDAHNKVYTTGTFMNSVDMDTGQGSLFLTSQHFLDMFVHRISPCTMSYDTINVTHCGNYTSPSGNNLWSTSGIYIDVITNLSGCDSVITINLTVIPLPFRIISVSECNSYTSPSGNHQWTSSGVFHDTIPNFSGCDSLLIINLIILGSTDSIVEIACFNYTSPSGLYNWTTSGVYNDTLINSYSCDSIIVIDLTINNSSYSSISVNECYNYLSPSGIYNWSSSGVYIDTITNMSGCDSIITVNLTILQEGYSTLEVATCGSYMSPSGIYIWTSSGNYIDTIQNSVGCDSIIYISLNILNNDESMSITVCDSLISPSGNYVWSSTGIYSDTITNINGCDSILTIYLSVNSVFAEIIMLDELTLQAQSTITSNYQWLDCASNFSAISGAVNQIFVATENGSYSVILNQNGCSDTSDCIDILTVNSKPIDFLASSTLFPNPTNDWVTLTNNTHQNIIKCQLLNVYGQILDINYPETNTSFTQVINGEPGIYFLVLYYDNATTIQLSVVKY